MSVCTFMYLKDCFFIYLLLLLFLLFAFFSYTFLFFISSYFLFLFTFFPLHCSIFHTNGEALRRVVLSSPKIAINLLRTYEKLHCKGERTISVLLLATDRQIYRQRSYYFYTRNIKFLPYQKLCFY